MAIITQSSVVRNPSNTESRLHRLNDDILRKRFANSENTVCVYSSSTNGLAIAQSSLVLYSVRSARPCASLRSRRHFN